MALNAINEAVRQAQYDADIARIKGDKRAMGEALARLREARTRQMKRDKRKRQGQFSPEAIEAARAAAVVTAKVAAVGLYLGGLAGLALGAQLIIGA